MYDELLAKLKKMQDDEQRIEMSLHPSPGTDLTQNVPHICKIDWGRHGTFNGITNAQYDVLVDIYDTRYKK